MSCEGEGEGEGEMRVRLCLGSGRGEMAWMAHGFMGRMADCEDILGIMLKPL